MLVGANDLCGACPSDNHTDSQPDFWINMYDGFITKIYETLPKTFVAVTSLLNISIVWDAMMKDHDKKQQDHCMDMRKHFHECPCLDSGKASDRASMDLYTVAFNQRLENMATQWQQKNLTDFYVSYQPFLGGLTIPNMTFLSPLDCFHPSWEAHRAFATTMWNSLFLPPAEKPTAIQLTDYLFCPTVNNYLQ